VREGWVGWQNKARKLGLTASGGLSRIKKVGVAWPLALKFCPKSWGWPGPWLHWPPPIFCYFLFIFLKKKKNIYFLNKKI
jgi:hypothetical protein